MTQNGLMGRLITAPRRSARTASRLLLRLGVGAGAAAAALVAGGDVASAEITGDCAGSATLESGEIIDPEDDGPFEIPRTGSATYEGGLTGFDGRVDDRDFNGRVVVKTPPWVPDIEFDDDWTWKGPGSGTGRSGTISWKLPDILPSGVPFRVEGEHNDDLLTSPCTGFVFVRVAGGFFDSPLGVISIGGTAVAALGTGAAMVAKREVAS